MPQIVLYDPTGSTEISVAHAPRPDTLNGKRVAFLTNEQWQAYFALPALKAQIEADFPGAEVLEVDAFPKGNDQISSDRMAVMLKEQRIDAVIIGNAA
jgi:hypothetical protein